MGVKVVVVVGHNLSKKWDNSTIVKMHIASFGANLDLVHMIK